MSTIIISEPPPLDQNGVEIEDHILTKTATSLAVHGIVSKLKLKLGSRKKLRKTADDDFDDNASVSSSMSSASEHSLKNEKKTKKVKKQHCEIHSKSSKSKDAASIDNDSSKVESRDPSCEPDGDVEAAEQPKCTCRKTLKNKTKVKMARPDPEGSDPSKTGFMDDLERVIYGDEPLFSDLEDEDPALEEHIRAESERFHRRITDPENIFSAVQMLNTNTMMKLAIIQTELKNVKDVSLRRSESEIMSAAKRVEVLRESFEHTENSFRSVSNQLSEALKAIGPLDSKPTSNTRGGADDKRQSLPVDKEQHRAVPSYSDIAPKRRPFYGKLLINEVDLEVAACNLEIVEIKVSDIEDEQFMISNTRKSRNLNEYEDLMRRLAERLVQAERQAHEGEQTVISFQKQLSDLEDERRSDKKKYKPLSAEINATFAELSVF